MLKRLAALCAPLVCSIAVASAPGPRTLTFDDRVNAQEAIERVYHAHRIGEAAPFEIAVPRAVLEAKVRKYLERSHGQVTEQMLEAELDRMSRGTKMPERLSELYAALGNDPLLLRECLARP